MLTKKIQPALVIEVYYAIPNKEATIVSGGMSWRLRKPARLAKFSSSAKEPL